MKSITNPLIQKITIPGIFIDIFALAFIYLVPTISHLFSVPVYLIEPMRLMLILALVHSSKTNGYLLALTMPLFSLVISGHPVFPKMILMAIELVFNVFLFYVLIKKVKPIFPAIFLSIVMSKILYYLLKFLLIKFTILTTDLITTPIIFQLVTTLIFSLYFYIFYKKSGTMQPI